MKVTVTVDEPTRIAVNGMIEPQTFEPSDFIELKDVRVLEFLPLLAKPPAPEPEPVDEGLAENPPKKAGSQPGGIARTQVRGDST